MMEPEPETPTPPSAFFVIGPAGSGKSTVSKLLARELGTAYLDKDSIATGFTELILGMSGNDPHERDNNALYQSRILPIEYQTLLRVCGDNLAVGCSVVIDAPFGRYFGDEGYLLEAKDAYGWPPARLVVVHVVADGDVVLARLRERHEPRDEWKVRNWEQFWAGATATACRWLGAAHVMVDNSGERPDFSELKQLHRGADPVRLPATAAAGDRRRPAGRRPAG
jgi:predicted kinase